MEGGSTNIYWTPFIFLLINSARFPIGTRAFQKRVVSAPSCLDLPAHRLILLIVLLIVLIVLLIVLIVLLIV